MEHFVVSARKYRPQTFVDVVGQQAITNTLESAIANNHLAQALLFCGPRGVGKTSCARILAKVINTDEHTSPDEEFAFNVFELDAASNNSVDDIRSLIDQVRIPPQTGKYKVYIIDEVHMLSKSAFNAFLKTLEEPPKHAIFILATTEKHKIIPTILSRCQIFDFKRITVTDAREHLKRIAAFQGITADEDALHIIAQKADGAMRDALSIFDRVVSFSGKNLTRKAVTENLNVLDYDTYFKATDLILQNNIPQLLVLFNDILTTGFDGHHFIAGLASHFRDLMMCKNPATIPLLEVGDQTKAKYAEQAKIASPSFLMQAVDKANEGDLKYKTSRNQRLLVELTLMQLASITLDGEKKNSEPYIISPDKAREIAAKNVDAHASETPIASETSETSQKDKSEVNAEDESVTETNNTSETTTLKTEAVPSFNDAAQPSLPSQSQQPPSDSQAESRKETTKSAIDKADDTDDTPATLSDNPEVAQAPQALNAESSAPIAPKIAPRADRVSGLSLKSLQKKKEILEQKAEKVIDTSNLPHETFTEAQMLETWNAYIAILNKKGEKIMASNLQTDTPKLDGTTISIEFPNDTMRVELERAQGPLLEYLKRSLSNYSITLNIEVNEETQRKYAYTSEEKFDRMRELNPAIEILKNTFDLEI